jgi:NADH dehydrogenase [ubiquinone] 1 alpha subcomplex assembly factor 5
LPTDANGRVPMTLHLAMMTGWAPSPDQPQPLRRGQATIRLEDALAALPDPPLPDLRARTKQQTESDGE